MPVSGLRVTTPWLYALTGEVQSFSAKGAAAEAVNVSHQQLRAWRSVGQMGARCLLLLLMCLPLYGDTSAETFIFKGFVTIGEEQHGILLPIHPVGLLVQLKTGNKQITENDVLHCQPKMRKKTVNEVRFVETFLDCKDRELVVTGIVFDPQGDKDAVKQGKSPQNSARRNGQR